MKIWVIYISLPHMKIILIQSVHRQLARLYSTKYMKKKFAFSDIQSTTVWTEPTIAQPSRLFRTFMYMYMLL